MSDLNSPSRSLNTNTRRLKSSQSRASVVPRKSTDEQPLRRPTRVEQKPVDQSNSDGFKKIKKTVILKDKDGNERRVLREFLVGPDGRIVRQDPNKKPLQAPATKLEAQPQAKVVPAPKTQEATVVKKNTTTREPSQESLPRRKEGEGLRKTNSVSRREGGELRASRSRVLTEDSSDSSLKAKSTKQLANEILAKQRKEFRRANARTSEKPNFHAKPSNKGLIITILVSMLVVFGAAGYFHIDQRNKAYVEKYRSDFLLIKDAVPTEVIETTRSKLVTLETYKNARSILFSNIETNAINEIRKNLDSIETRIVASKEFKKSVEESKINEDNIQKSITSFEELKKSNGVVNHSKVQEIEKEISDSLNQKYKKLWRDKAGLIEEIVDKNISSFMYDESLRYLADEKQNFGEIKLGEESDVVKTEINKLVAKVEKNKTVYDGYAEKVAAIKKGNAEETKSQIKEVQASANTLEPEFHYIRDWVIENSDKLAEDTTHSYRATYKGYLEKGEPKPESVFIKENNIKKATELPIFAEAKADELNKIAAFFAKGLPESPQFKIVEATNNFEIPYDDSVILGGFAQINNVRSVLLYFKGFELFVSPKELGLMGGGGKSSQYHMNQFLKAAHKYLLNPSQKNGKITWHKNSDISIRSPGLQLFGIAAPNHQYLMVNDLIFENSNVQPDNAKLQNNLKTFRSSVEKIMAEIAKSYSNQKEIANPILLLLEGLLKDLDPNHFITHHFANLVFKNGYALEILPNPSNELKNLILDTMKMYNETVDVYDVMWAGKASDESEFESRRTLTGKVMSRIYDATRDETTFVGVPYVTEINFLQFSDTTYSVVAKGKKTTWPQVDEIIRYETYHFNGGRIALYDTKEKKLHVDEQAWNQYVMEPRNNVVAVYGEATWRHPPHVLILDENLSVDGVIVPGGIVAPIDLSKATPENSKKIMDDWLDDVAQKMPLIGELHFLFRYLFKYTFDSPVPNINNLIGNNRDRGEFHQTVYQTLERKLGDKMLCDCDDLAEVYSDITRRQNKISFVFGVPGHATCGWVEKTEDGRFAMNFLDTGVPRRFVAKTLDEAVKLGVNSYDNQNTVDFNPRSVQFLLRFAGEQIRQGYYLDSKVLVDEVYSQKMVDVQEGWHFHYYLQSLKIMEELTKNDPMPANYFEISGLHRQMGDYKTAAKIHKQGLDKLDANDKRGYLQNYITYLALIIRDDKSKVAEHTAILQNLISDVEKSHGRGLLHQRFNLANMLLTEKRAVEAYDVIKNDLKNAKSINMNFIGTLSSIVFAINDKKEPKTNEEKEIIKNLSALVNDFINKNLFTAQDDIRGSIYKYSIVYSKEASENGSEASIKKLLVKDYPKNIELKHFNRQKANAEEDWRWIRLNVSNYYSAMLNALKTDDKKTPPTEQQWAKAFEINEYLEATYAELRKHGLSGSFEYIYLITQLFQASKKKEWAKVDEIFDRMQKEEWTIFYRMVASQVGSMSVFLAKEEFMILVKKFFDHKPPKHHYLEIAYGCLANGKKDYCLDVAKLVLKYHPNDPKIAEEVKLLEPYLKTRPNE